MAASDYNPEGVARLRRVFIESDRVECFDITKDDWSEIQPAGNNAAVLMYRVDPQLSDKEWRAVFERMAQGGIQNILYIPSNEISFQYLTVYWLRTMFARWKGDSLSFAGYIRSAKAFPVMWSDLYSHEAMRLGGLKSYWLSSALKLNLRNEVSVRTPRAGGDTGSN